MVVLSARGYARTLIPPLVSVSPDGQHQTNIGLEDVEIFFHVGFSVGFSVGFALGIGGGNPAVGVAQAIPDPWRGARGLVGP
jgi:hypothetical protein